MIWFHGRWLMYSNEILRWATMASIYNLLKCQSFDAITSWNLWRCTYRLTVNFSFIEIGYLHQIHLFNWIITHVVEQTILLDHWLNRLLLLMSPTGEFLILELPWTGISPNLISVFVLKLNNHYFHSTVTLWLAFCTLEQPSSTF